jgi:hypothetical protein
LDEAPEDLVGEEQVRARDQTGDEDDGGALDQLLLAGPVDLLQLGPRLADEALAARAGDVVAVGALGGLGRRAYLRLRRLRLLLRALRRALDGCAALGLGRTAGAALVSRCAVWRPHQRQYFLNSTRSGLFRFDFSVW